MLEQFIVSKDPELNGLANQVLQFLARNYEIRTLTSVYVAGIKSPLQFVRDNTAQSIVALGEADPDKVVQLYSDLITGMLSPDSQVSLVSTFEQIRKTTPEILEQALVPLLDKNVPDVRRGVLKILKMQIAPLRPQYDIILPKLLQITQDEDNEQVEDAIEILGNLVAFDTSKAPVILNQIEELRNRTGGQIRQKLVSSLVAIAVALPDRIDELFPKVLAFLDDQDPEVRVEVGESCIAAGVAFAGDEKFDYVEQVLLKLLVDPVESVRIYGAQTTAVIAKSNPILAQTDPDFIQLLIMIIKDPSEKARDNAVDVFTYLVKVNPSLRIFHIPLALLEEQLSVESGRTVLRIIHNIIEEFPWEENIEQILNPLLAFNRSDDTTRRKLTDICFLVMKTRPETFALVSPAHRAS